jgi:O-antigen chain-terminating methyltransferase
VSGESHNGGRAAGELGDGGSAAGLDPDVTVDEIIDRVRTEAARRRTAPGAPPAPRSIALQPDFQHLQVLLSHAKRVADTGTAVPPYLTFGPLRRALAQVVTRALYFVLQVITVDQSVFNKLILQALHTVSGGLRQGEKDLATRLDQLIAMLADLRAKLDRLELDSSSRAAELGSELARQQTEIAAQMASWHAQMARVQEQMAGGQEQMARVQEQMAGGQEQMARVQEELAAEVKVRRRVAPGDDASGELPANLAGLYAAFEDRFRGSRESIVARVREHLPTVQAAGAGTAERPVLDLGCGRGEWLEVLREANLQASGVDTNPVLIEQCRARGLAVEYGDALRHLRTLRDASVGAVTAVHLLEHLPFATLIALIDETVRVLAPGGVAIFETPNASNLLVGACSFHTDPTHETQLAPEVLQFLVEARGLARVEIRPLPRHAPFPPLPDDAPPALQHLVTYLDTADDYAVIGYRD